jgi:hypothetical protein
MACVDQLSGYYPVYNAIDTIGYNDRQLATAYRLLNSLSYGQIFHSIFGRGSSALRANELVYELLQSPLPPTQWVIEVSNWFAVSLSRLQHAIVEFASGPTSLPSEASVITPTAPGWPIMCKSQKVKDSGTHQNFSILALGLIFGIGVMIIILSWTLEPCINSRRRKRNPGSHRRIQWILDSKLLLLRMVYQYIGVGEWEGKARDVPTTIPLDEEKIFMLPNTIDPENPGLSHRHDVWTPSGTMNRQMMNKNMKGANAHVAHP